MSALFGNRNGKDAPNPTKVFYRNCGKDRRYEVPY